MENTCNNNMPVRRRRLCSVVAPELGVEYTKGGRRTVVVGTAKTTTCTDTSRMSPIPQESVSQLAISQRLYSSGCDFTGTPTRKTNGLTRHNSLPKRVNFRQIENSADLRNSAIRAAFRQRINSYDDRMRNDQTEFISSGFLPSPVQQNISEMDNLKVPCQRRELAINLTSCQNNEAMAKMNGALTRKTQRSMSAHSVALPGPDSTVLRDPISGKMYKRGKLLGKGGFARVYEGIDLSTNKKYALKIIDKSRIARPPQREKVDAEIELHAAASEVGHPNVAKFETTFENARIICLVMELCEKRSLAQYLRRKEYISESEVSDLTWQIVCGLAHIHGCGLLHRDLKLGNILLGDDMTVKLGDFGLATRASWGKRRTICGTPNFIAPEVLQRQGHGPEADIWAVGCILFTLLVGKPPFETTSLKDTYKCILKNSYRIPSTVSPEAADLVRWMLRSKPHARPTLNDITNHVFFVKHQTAMRYPTIDQLAETYPSKEISPESALPLRRKSVLPRLTVNNNQSCSGSYSSVGSSSGQVRHNSCPSDPCSVYSDSGRTNQVRNDPSSSVGPKISILDHMKRVASDEENKTSSNSVSSGTCVEDVAESKNTPTAEQDLISEPAIEQKPQIPAEYNNNTPKECYTPEANTKISTKCDNISSRKHNKSKASPVKLLASKLQKFKIPSPKSCMKAAAHTMKSKANDYKSANAQTVIQTKAEENEKLSHATWITKWVDYSNKYGFGYQLADGSICVLFNDGAHIALLADGNTVEYTEPDWASSSNKSLFSIQSPPAAFLRPVKILQHFTAYMDKNLRKAGDGNCEDSSSTASVRMLTWSRTSEHVAMYLSNGTMQVNFCSDHTKINVSNIHKSSMMTVTYVNENKETSVYEASQLSNITDTGLKHRMQQVHKEFHCLLGNDNCISHPFCGILKNETAEEASFKPRDTMIVVA
uniref:serine/threonine-protein kinase PLK1-like n=1 Tax=Styela clava TaxID=7725 RepID=UPI00193ABB24|nr:serine/threonine-protein kinase PLK1-like [Styela clava]